MKRIALLGSLLISILCSTLWAQNSHISESWGGYITQIRLNDRISIWNDAHFVPYNFIIHRHGMSYHFKNGARLSGGYAHLYQAPPLGGGFDRDEMRPWWQIQHALPLSKKWLLGLRFRHDMRFREQIVSGLVNEDTFLFNHRFRFLTNFRLFLPNKNPAYRLHLNFRNEYHHDIGADVHNGMNQNRTALMLGIAMKDRTILTGYQVRTFELRATDSFRYNHGFVFWFIQNFDIRR